MSQGQLTGWNAATGSMEGSRRSRCGSRGVLAVASSVLAAAGSEWVAAAADEQQSSCLVFSLVNSPLGRLHTH